MRLTTELCAKLDEVGRAAERVPLGGDATLGRAGLEAVRLPLCRTHLASFGSTFSCSSF